jgi:hypothetical protein
VVASSLATIDIGSPNPALPARYGEGVN